MTATLSLGTIDQLHSALMDDDMFNEAVMRVALQIAEANCPEGDEEEVMDLAMSLAIRVSVA
jgi:hypothetical protein